MQIAKAEPETKRLRKQAGTWLKELRARAGLSQIELAEILGFKYYTFISQVENGFGRLPTASEAPRTPPRGAGTFRYGRAPPRDAGTSRSIAAGARAPAP